MLPSRRPSFNSNTRPPASRPASLLASQPAERSSWAADCKFIRPFEGRRQATGLLSPPPPLEAHLPAPVSRHALRSPRRGQRPCEGEGEQQWRPQLRRAIQSNPFHRSLRPITFSHSTLARQSITWSQTSAACFAWGCRPHTAPTSRPLERSLACPTRAGQGEGGGRNSNGERLLLRPPPPPHLDQTRPDQTAAAPATKLATATVGCALWPVARPLVRSRRRSSGRALEIGRQEAIARALLAMQTTSGLVKGICLAAAATARLQWRASLSGLHALACCGAGQTKEPPGAPVVTTRTRGSERAPLVVRPQVSLGATNCNR